MDLVGGAYSNPASEGFFLRYKSLVAAAKSQDVDLAVFVLSYGEAVSVAGTNNVLNLSQDLSPKATYPTQLKQAAGSLEYLLKNKGLTPAGVSATHSLLPILSLTYVRSSSLATLLAVILRWLCFLTSHTHIRMSPSST